MQNPEKLLLLANESQPATQVTYAQNAGNGVSETKILHSKIFTILNLMDKHSYVIKNSGVEFHCIYCVNNLQNRSSKHHFYSIPSLF